MPKTISFQNGANWSRGHNIRDERFTGKQEHIDSFLTPNNVTIRDVPVRQAYEDIFGKSVNEYNSRQKRKDRRIDCYYDKIKQDKRKQPIYECIVQIGDKDNTGNSAELEKQALIKFAEEWDKRNPNLRLVGAYIHCDEINGTVHLHLDYIPVAECSRGMRLQNSLDRALQQQGFTSENIHKTAQIAWQDSERESLCAICRELNIDAQRNQGITGDRKHLSKNEYIRVKEEQKKQIEEELQPLRGECERLEHRVIELESKLSQYIELEVQTDEVSISKKKVPLTKQVAVSVEDLAKIEEQAKAYCINRDSIKSLDRDRMALALDRQNLAEKQRIFEDEKYSERLKLQAEKEEISRLYEEQININEVLQTEKETNCSLSDENGSLRHEIDKKGETILSLKKCLKSSVEALVEVSCSISSLKDENNLTEEQLRLISAVKNVAIHMLEKIGIDKAAEKIKTESKIAKSVKQEMILAEPKPIKKSKGFSR